MAKSNGIDLSKLSIEELENLARDIETEVNTRRVAERERVLQQMRDLAASIGATPEQLFGAAGKPTAKTVVVKYRHPDNPALTWSGRGKRPLWVVEYLTVEGRRMEDLAAG